MKTPIQELIRKIELMQVADYVVNPLGIIKDIATDLLEKEKQMIIDAVNYGKTYHKGFDFDGTQYYNETFKND